MFQIKNFDTRFIVMQKIIPAAVGRAAASAVHLRLPVSFFIVRSVVAHGQCIMEKNITLSAVSAVQPFAMKSSYSSDRLSYSISVPDEV